MKCSCRQNFCQGCSLENPSNDCFLWKYVVFAWLTQLLSQCFITLFQICNIMKDSYQIWEMRVVFDLAEVSEWDWGNCLYFCLTLGPCKFLQATLAGLWKSHVAGGTNFPVRCTLSDNCDSGLENNIEMCRGIKNGNNEYYLIFLQSDNLHYCLLHLPTHIKSLAVHCMHV